MTSLRRKVKDILGIQNAERLLRAVRSARAVLYRPVRKIRRKFFTTPNPLTMRRFGQRGKHTFFGYYDVTPFDLGERYLLAAQVSASGKTTPSLTPLSLGYYDLEEPKPVFHEIGQTSTWCWQQGCRLQWFPFSGRKAVLYNRVIEGRYGCVIQDIFSKELLRTFQNPIYAIDPKGQWALSLNFSRLQRLRPGYGYANLPDRTENQAAPEEEGIWKINLENGVAELLISLRTISEWEPLPGMAQATHYFNHLHFNPSSSRFLMFHIWEQNKKRRTRLITADLNGQNRFPLINEGHVSHYAWKSENEIIAYATHAGTGTRYYQYRDQSQERMVVGKDHLTEDGHPSFSPDGSILLTDTYPDKNRHQHLLLYKIKEGRLQRLESFFSPMRYYGEQRCDLHPRWSPSGNQICIDSAHESHRAVYVINKWNISYS